MQPPLPRPPRRTASLVLALVLAALCALVTERDAAGAARETRALALDSTVALPVPGPPGRPSRAALAESGLLVHDFAPPSVRWGAGHRGVDLAVPEGTTVTAPQAGVVTWSGVVVDRPLVVVTHASGLRSTLEPVSESPPVGTAVAQGDPVGVVAAAGLSHCAPQACVHWGVRDGERYLDPLALLRVLEPVVLLPLG